MVNVYFLMIVLCTSLNRVDRCQSRIMIWVSTLNIREAQYNIGHRFVSSTESYAIKIQLN